MSRLKPLVKELIKHHEFARKLQVEVVQRTEAARQSLAQRGGAESIKAHPPAPKHEIAEFDPSTLNSWKLEQIKDKDLVEISAYLKHQLQYKELLARYQSAPQDTLDRVHATARRVGLDASKL